MSDEKVAICFEQGLDEAFLVGTKAEITEFAKSILRRLEQNKRKTDYLGVPVQEMGAALTQTSGQVELHAIYLVKNVEDRRMLMNKILKNNGEHEIDWEEYDSNRI